MMFTTLKLTGLRNKKRNTKCNNCILKVFILNFIRYLLKLCNSHTLLNFTNRNNQLVSFALLNKNYHSCSEATENVNENKIINLNALSDQFSILNYDTQQNIWQKPTQKHTKLTKFIQVSSIIFFSSVSISSRSSIIETGATTWIKFHRRIEVFNQFIRVTRAATLTGFFLASLS